MKKVCISFFIALCLNCEYSIQAQEIDPTVYLQTERIQANEQSAQKAIHATITMQEMSKTPITDYLGGQLFEIGYGDMEGPMWAEMFYNRKFEKFPPYMVNRNYWYMTENLGKNDLKTDWTVFPWYHSGYEHNYWFAAPGEEGSFHIDPQTTFFKETTPLAKVRLELLQHNPDNQYVKIINDDDKPAGIAQEGKWIRKGISYYFKGKFRKVKGNGKASLLLFPEKDWSKPLVEIPIEDIRSTTEFVEKNLTISNISYEGRATFALFIEEGSSIEIDDFSLMPEDNVRGWRKDVIELVKRIKPGALRWPGGCFASFYDWEKGVGNRDARIPQRSTMWGGWTYHDIGTLEYLNFCELTGSTPFISVNMYHPAKILYEYYDPIPGIYAIHHERHPEFTDMTIGAQKAADWVAYCNADITHPMGARRAKEGHPKPFHVKFWELDNELFRWFQTPEEYARAASFYAKAMKKVDPTIQIGLCVYGGRLGGKENVKTMLEIAGRDIDFLANRGPSEAAVTEKLEIAGEYNQKTGRNIKYADTEYFLGGDSYTQPIIQQFKEEKNERCLEHVSWAYSLALAKNLMMWQRFGGDVLFTNYNSFVNDHQHNILETPKEGVLQTFPGYIFELFNHSPARWPLHLDGYEVNENKPFQVQAAWDKNREKIVLYIYNSLPQEQEASFQLDQLPIKFSTTTIKMLSAPALMMYSSVKEPRKLTQIMKHEKIKDKTVFKWKAKPYSFTEIVLEK